MAAETDKVKSRYVCVQSKRGMGIGVQEGYSKNIPGRGELLDCLGDFDSPPAEASVVVPMMTMMYYILGRAARLIVLDWTGSVGWVAVRATRMEEDKKVK
jgi:hypothetical protein